MKKLILLGLFLAAAVAASAKIVTRAVAYEHSGVKLEGFLAYDDEKTAASKIPGVLIVHEWWGVNDYVKNRAQQLARLGYVAFALDMYGVGKATDDPKRAGELAGQFYGKPLMAERAQAGLEQLLKTGLTDGQRVAAIGYCFGGAVAQVLAYSGAPLAGIVSFHGSLVPASADAAAKNKAKFLVCHGGADSFISKDQMDAFLKSMNEGKFDYQFVIYADALHAFTNPRADRVRAEKGMNIGYNAVADRRSWLHLQAFFSELFATEK